MLTEATPTSLHYIAKRLIRSLVDRLASVPGTDERMSDRATSKSADIMRLCDAMRSIEPARPERTRREGSSRSFVVFGTPQDRIAFTTVIRAFALAGRWGDRLTLIGFGPHRRRLEKWATALRIDNMVSFADPDPGTVNGGVGHDVVVLVSAGAEHIRVLLHALIDGLAVLATTENEMAAVLLGISDVGRLFPPRDVSGLSHAMISVTEPDPIVVQSLLASYRSRDDVCTPAMRLRGEPATANGQHCGTV